MSLRLKFRIFSLCNMGKSTGGHSVVLRHGCILPYEPEETSQSLSGYNFN